MTTPGTLIQFPKLDAAHPGRGDDAPRPKPPASPSLVRADEVARALGVHPTTVARRARSGIIPSVRVGRALRFDLDAVREAITRSPRPQGAHDESDQRDSTGSPDPRTPRGGGRPVPHPGDAGRAEADAPGCRGSGVPATSSKPRSASASAATCQPPRRTFLS
ncbi:MAG: helix-turn-helix domain-containing protein [Deltaproteobacteria bacterium]|nr:helix-turn-helix domain-containing protein [Deltaproteobacteria bacterium]